MCKQRLDGVCSRMIKSSRARILAQCGSRVKDIAIIPGAVGEYGLVVGSDSSHASATHCALLVQQRLLTTEK